MHVDHHSFVADHPELADKIHELKASNAHFAGLMTEHETIDKDICRREDDENDTSTDGEMEDLKKKRLHISDEIIAMIQA